MDPRGPSLIRLRISARGPLCFPHPSVRPCDLPSVPTSTTPTLRVCLLFCSNCSNNLMRALIKIRFFTCIDFKPVRQSVSLFSRTSQYKKEKKKEKKEKKKKKKKKKKKNKLQRVICNQKHPFWAAEPKGTMSYRTEGGISVRPNKRASVRPIP